MMNRVTQRSLDLLGRNRVRIGRPIEQQTDAVTRGAELAYALQKPLGIPERGHIGIRDEKHLICSVQGSRGVRIDLAARIDDDELVLSRQKPAELLDGSGVAGTAHRELAAAICRSLKKRLSPCSITRFSNDCLRVQLQANCREADVFIIQPLVPPVQDHLVELLLMMDAARGASAARITAVIPHYAYARSD